MLDQVPQAVQIDTHLALIRVAQRDVPRFKIDEERIALPTIREPAQQLGFGDGAVRDIRTPLGDSLLESVQGFGGGVLPFSMSDRVERVIPIRSAMSFCSSPSRVRAMTNSRSRAATLPQCPLRGSADR
jgi:hypothetical protein